VTGCDMPFIVPQLVRLLLEHADGADVVVPLVRGFYEPLFSVYCRSCVAAIERALDEGRFRVTSIYPELRIREIAEAAVRSIDPDLVSFTNLNTPKQLALLARL
jgi:molybdopterin-guanine dinucleotide biosynthesis protein A